MAFTVEDFQDLLELLRAHPEWRRRLWELLASEELLRLPAEVKAFREEFEAFRDQTFEAFRQETERRFQRVEEQIAALAEAQRRHYEEFAACRAETDRRFAELVEAQRRTEERVEQLAEAQRRTEERVEQLVEVIRQLTERVDRLERRTEDHARDLGKLKKYSMENRYRERSVKVFRGLLRGAKPVPDEWVDQVLEEAVAAGRITEGEADDAAQADLVVEGFHRREGRKIYLVVEISDLGDTEDVRRAANRAAIFARAFQAEVWPVVGAEELTDLARKAARDLRVWWVQDGRAFPPREIPEEAEGAGGTGESFRPEH